MSLLSVVCLHLITLINTVNRWTEKGNRTHPVYFNSFCGKINTLRVSLVTKLNLFLCAEGLFFSQYFLSDQCRSVWADGSAHPQRFITHSFICIIYELYVLKSSTWKRFASERCWTVYIYCAGATQADPEVFLKL